MAYGINGPQGLVPRSYLNGSLWNQQFRTYRIASGYNGNLFTGDIVTLGAGNVLQLWVPGTNPAVTPPLGVFQGWRDAYSPSFTSSGFPPATNPNWVAGTVVSSGFGLANVIDDWAVVYSIQVSQNAAADGTSTAIGLLLGETGLNADIAIGVVNRNTFAPVNGPGGTYTPPPNPLTGDLATGVSRYFLDYTTRAITATLPLKIIDLDGNGLPPLQLPYHAAAPTTGVFNNVLVILNQQLYKDSHVGVAA